MPQGCPYIVFGKVFQFACRTSYDLLGIQLCMHSHGEQIDQNWCTFLVSFYTCSRLFLKENCTSKNNSSAGKCWSVHRLVSDKLLVHSVVYYQQLENKQANQPTQQTKSKWRGKWFEKCSQAGTGKCSKQRAVTHRRLWWSCWAWRAASSTGCCHAERQWRQSWGTPGPLPVLAAGPVHETDQTVDLNWNESPVLEERKAQLTHFIQTWKIPRL